MRDPDRIDQILTRLGDLWKQSPDMRFYQIIQYITPSDVSDTFYVEDDRALRWIEQRIEQQEEDEPFDPAGGPTL